MFFDKLLKVASLALFVAIGAYAFGVKKAPEAPKAETAPVAVATPANASPASDKTWVKKPDGGLSCDTDKKAVKPLEAGAMELKKAGVEVFESKKANDGMMRAAMCGISTGNENHYLIASKDVEKARKLGYELTQ